MHGFTSFIGPAAGAMGMVLAAAAVIHLLPRLGKAGKGWGGKLAKAPGLDWLMTYLIAGPLAMGIGVGGVWGLLGAAAGQVAGVLVWTWVHELTHLEAVVGPRIVKVHRRRIGAWRNHAALWLTAVVTPMFWVVRMAEVFLYPPMARLVGFPRYDSSEWVNVSRHKFAGLVGHDLIWCLYCDWMTGVWSLGSEMLRNVESFWCPIRFSDAKKCENCALDFPDLNGGWVGAEGTMGEVVEAVEKIYEREPRAWFGHAVTVTVKGKEVGDEGVIG